MSSASSESESDCESEDIDVPDDIVLDTIIEDICFHPEKNVIAYGDIDGVVGMYSYSKEEKNHPVMTLNHHKKACRAIRFSASGERLFTASKDKSLQMIDVNQGAVAQSLKKAHDSALYSLLSVDENIVVTGDEDGCIKVWDMRHNKAVMEERQCEEFISDMILARGKHLLVATSGEGTLTAFDIRKHKMVLQSELFDSELLSLALIKYGTKVACGTGEGALNLFNYGEWGNLCDRFPGHPVSIDCMVPVSENIICTGSFDGMIRAVHIIPNRFLGIVGQHDHLPVESLSVTADQLMLASCSHDQLIKFWDVSDIHYTTVNPSQKKSRANKTKMIGKEAERNFFADMEEETGESSKAGDNQEKSDSEANNENCDNSDTAANGQVESGHGNASATSQAESGCGNASVKIESNAESGDDPVTSDMDNDEMDSEIELSSEGSEDELTSDESSDGDDAQ